MFKPNFNKDPKGLLPAIAQDAKTGEVLMLAYVNQEAWEATLSSGLATYWSRSRNELWQKGASSGNTQKIIDIFIDCDEDTIIYKVNQTGPACHTGKKNCFFRKLSADTKNLEDC